MTQQDPGWQGPGAARDAVSAAIVRERGRARMRAATLVAGAASLATAGVVALNLPGPAHTSPVSTITTPPSSPPSSPTVVYAGDDGGDGGSRATAQQPASQRTSTPHTTSGGS